MVADIITYCGVAWALGMLPAWTVWGYTLLLRDPMDIDLDRFREEAVWVAMWPVFVVLQAFYASLAPLFTYAELTTLPEYEPSVYEPTADEHCFRDLPDPTDQVAAKQQTSTKKGR